MYTEYFLASFMLLYIFPAVRDNSIRFISSCCNCKRQTHDTNLKTGKVWITYWKCRCCVHLLKAGHSLWVWSVTAVDYNVWEASVTTGCTVLPAHVDLCRLLLRPSCAYGEILFSMELAVFFTRVAVYHFPQCWLFKSVQLHIEWTDEECGLVKNACRKREYVHL